MADETGNSPLFDPEPLRGYLKKSFVGVVVYDIHLGHLIEINDSALEIFGYSQDEVIHNPQLFQNLFFNNTFKDFETKILNAALAYGYSSPANFAIVKKNETIAYIKIQGFMVEDKILKKQYLYCHLVDFTEYTHMMVYLDEIKSGKASRLKEKSEQRIFERKLAGRNLTPAELKICWMLRNGFGTNIISQRLKISPATVLTHRKHIRHKLDLTSQKKTLIEYLIEFT